MPKPRADFELALLTDRVAARASRLAMEHDTPEALSKYLKEHPDADKAKHTVKKPEGKQPAKDSKGTPKKKAPKKESKPKDDLDNAIAKASPHKLRDQADAAEKSGDFAKAFDYYSAAAEVFRKHNSPDAAKSMDAAAKEMAIWHDKMQKKKAPKTRADYQREQKQDYKR